MLTRAVRDKRIPSNPADGVDLPPIVEPKRRYLTAAEVTTLADAAGRHRLAVLMLSYCGLRWSELAALRTINAEAEKVAAQAAADNANRLPYLLRLCELELLDRDKRAAERQLKAGPVFPTMKTLDVRPHRPPLGEQDAHHRAGLLPPHHPPRQRAAGRKPGTG